MQDAADHHGHRHRIDRHVEVFHQEQRKEDRRQIPQHRREGRDLEFAPGVEHRPGQHHEGHAQDVGEHQARHDHARAESLALAFQAAGDRDQDERRTRDADQADQEGGPDQGVADVVDQGLGGGVALLALVFGQDRHEGLRERAFAEQPAQQVGQAEGDIEGVGISAGTEGTGEQGIAQQAGNAGQHRHARDGCQGTE